MTSIREAIYGDLATVFHRTSVKDLIDRVYTNGYKPGNGSMYGRGFYGTYELSSQESKYMSKTYGNIVVKFSVPVQDFVIFDEEEFSKTSNYKRMLREDPEAQFLVWQLEDFSGYVLKEKTRIEIEKFYAKNPKYTSDLALKIWKDIFEVCNGIIFTGSRDGHVLVCYEPKLIVPLSFREDGKKDFEKVPTNLKYLSDYVDSKFDIEREIDYSDLSGKGLKKLPKGIPEKISEGFNCGDNELTSLEGAPKEVGGNFFCHYNELASLEGAPQKVGVGFYCYENKITTLEGASKEVGGNFYCQNNNLTSLQGAPQKVGGSFDCSDNRLASIKGAPQIVGKGFDCSDNQIKSLKGAPQKVGGNFYCRNNNKKFTEEEVRAVCDVKGKVYV